MTSKNELYYSKHCNKCSKLIEQLNKYGLHTEFNYICIDNRKMVNNIIYILMPNGVSFPLPPMINRVPTLLTKPGNEVLVGEEQILIYVKPKAKNINEEKTMLFNDPSPFSLSNDNGNVYGVNSDRFSFLNTDLRAEGEGGKDQLYNYATINHTDEQLMSGMYTQTQQSNNLTHEKSNRGGFDENKMRQYVEQRKTEMYNIPPPQVR
jgi:hypothetical protein